MLKTGSEHLESLRDGRRVFIGGEKVTDVTKHPAFRNAARSFAMLYDKKALPENRDIMSFEEDGDVYSSWFLMPRSARISKRGLKRTEELLSGPMACLDVLLIMSLVLSLD